MLRAHHRSAYQYLARVLRPALGAGAAVLAAGLFGRYAVARLVPRIGDGAKPTRSADLLDNLDEDSPISQPGPVRTSA